MAATPRTVAFAHEGRDWIRGSEQCLLDLVARLDPARFRSVVLCNGPTLAREAERRAPELITTKWWKEERGEQIFLDYNQNARDRTIRSAYSVRAPEGRVSAPGTWGGPSSDAGAFR